MATFPSKVNYATGDVLTATNMNEIGQAINLLDGAQYSAGKNKIINGDFGINQRSFTSTTATGYGFDRWLIDIAGDGTTTWTPQVFTPGTAPVTGYESTNFSRIVTTGQTTAAVISRIGQKIENVRTLAGQTATVSFWAKAATGTPSIAPEFQQNFGTGGSPSATVNAIIASTPKQAITTAWARYSFNVAIPSISGKTIGTANDSSLTLGLYVSAGSNFNARTGSLGIQSNTFDIWGVQVEEADTASPFQTATGTYQGELALCQRYYFRTTSSTGSQTATGIMGITNSTTNLVGVIRPPVTMRAIPNSVEFSAIGVQSTGSGLTAATAVTISADSTNDTAQLNVTSSGFTANLYGLVRGTTGAGYVALNAELQEMTMDKVTFIEDHEGVEHAIIDRGNGEFTSMTKAHYEAMQADAADEAKTK